MARKGIRPVGDMDTGAETHSHGGSASQGWPVNPTCGITWNILQTYSGVSGSWPRILQFQTNSTGGFEV